VDNKKINDTTIFPLELNTMPGWAGSSWYFNRYMDAQNPDDFAGKEALNYWRDVDLYIGGSEHATGHLLYSRFWQKFLFDKGLVPVDEYAKKLINQGMILGTSAFVYRVFPESHVQMGLTSHSRINPNNSFFISKEYIELFKNDYSYSNKILRDIVDPLKTKIISLYSEIFNINLKEDESINIHDSYITFTVQPIRADVALVNASNELDIEGFKNHPLNNEYKNAEFIREEDKFIVGREVEKMSKSKHNVVNPDDICADYGADTLRLYEMFLGPLEQAKPWNTAGITGVHSFLKKLWKLYIKENAFYVSDDEPTKDELKTLHKTIKKVDEDIANFSFNTSVSSFMIAVNELTAQKCDKRAILEPLAILISPYAPHIAEEIWHKLGNKESISRVDFPVFDAKHLVESTKTYPISFNGKMRFTIELSLDLSKEEIEKAVLEHERTQKQLAGRTPKKVIVVPGKIVNIVG
jgi:leucyl-tRNA synthetase